MGALGLAATATATLPTGRGAMVGLAACCASSLATGFATGLVTDLGAGMATPRDPCGCLCASTLAGATGASRPMDLAAGTLVDIDLLAATVLGAGFFVATGAFFGATFRVAALLATGFAGAFPAGFFATSFFATGFLATFWVKTFLGALFLATGFLAAALPAAGLLVFLAAFAAFFTGFFAATSN